MRWLLLASCLVTFGNLARSEEKEPFPARTTPFLITPIHSHERTNTNKGIPAHATGSKSSHESGGYIGGGKLVHGEGRGVTDGVFGWDYTGFGRRPGRIFLGWYHDAPKQSEFLPKYNTEGRRVTDVFALQPFKKAVREARVEHQEKKSEGGPEKKSEGGHE